MMNRTGERMTERNEVAEEIDGPKVQVYKNINPAINMNFIIQRPSLMTFTCLFFGNNDKNRTKCKIANARKFNVVYF